jgi:hypothetical protein
MGGVGSFSSPLASRLAQGRIHRLILILLEALFPGVKRRMREACCSLMSSAEVNNGVAIRLNGVVFD